VRVVRGDRRLLRLLRREREIETMAERMNVLWKD